MNTWSALLQREIGSERHTELQQFIAHERLVSTVFPPAQDVYAALELTPFESTKVVVLGQDPYHGLGQAHGLSFSVRGNTPIPPSLRNIFQELFTDVAIQREQNGDLTGWARQGVLLLNTTLTVREGEPGSHKNRGWEHITDTVMSALNEKPTRVVFVLWGAHARNKKTLITQAHHVVIESAHPSPLSAHRGFFGSKPFSQINSALEEAGLSPIEWGQ
ncbi:MAG: uracil-DNA glycosylase [Actinobacteria bacterium]|nr:uracil-DNA glycosylase [Actinomycetota bacterium]